MNVPEIPLRRPPPPPKHKTMDFQTETTKDRLYPKPPPFSAREYYKQWEEDRLKPYESTMKRSPRLRGKYTMYGIERESRKPKPPPPEKVDAYIEMLRKSRPKYQKPFTPRPLLKSQIPIKLANPRNEQTAAPTPKPITNIFDKSDRFKVYDNGFTNNLPNIPITREMYDYVLKNGERMPTILRSIY